MNKEIENILIDIKNENIDRRSELIEQEYVLNLTRSVASSYSEVYNFDYDDVYQNSILAVYSLIDSFTLYKNKGKNIGGSFINYLKKYLPKRLNDYYEDYSIFRTKKGIDMYSIDAMESPENLIDNLVEEPFSDIYINILDIEQKRSKLEKKRDKEILDLIMEEYTQVEIARELGVSQPYISKKSKEIIRKLEK